MGYELELMTVARRPRGQAPAAASSVQVRWLAANRRLAAALGHYRGLRGHLAPGDPAWLAAQLRVAEARQRCRELEDALVADDELPDVG